MNDTVADDEVGPAALLEHAQPIAIAFYATLGARDRLVERMRALAAGRAVHVVTTGREALEPPSDGDLVLVLPSDEAAAVRFFERNRDRFVERGSPTLLFVMRGGPGEDALRDAPGLASLTREASFDAPLPTTAGEARAAFIAQHGCEPEAWLQRWRAGDLPDDIASNTLLAEALAAADER